KEQRPLQFFHRNPTIMANYTATGQPSTTMAAQVLLATPPSIPISTDTTSYSGLDYSKLLKSSPLNKVKSCPNESLPLISMKPITVLHGGSYLKWSVSEVNIRNVIENLLYVEREKYSYGWLESEVLHSAIPTQCNIKGDC
ncbi:hypothetical protein HAX54_024938, partial [Datura stramonium]|nr:hypothetical protein [Datura stramonium]